MHLDLNTIQKTIQEAHRVLKPNGVLVFDFPSKARRKLINYQKEGWHGNTALDIGSIEALTNGLFKLEGYEGVLLFPIHRIPFALRPFIRTLDSWLCKSFLKKWASYHFVFLKKK
jgi:SAM-dependent methyltransferase